MTRDLRIRFAALMVVLTAPASCQQTTAAPADDATVSLAARVREVAHPVTGVPGDYDPLFRAIGEDRFVLMGEATHGTHEFYAERARITLRLMEEREYGAVAVEAPWPASHRVNQYVRSQGGIGTPESALNQFTEFPEWMWRNAEVREFARELRALNGRRPPERQVGFYGIDLYSLYPSIDEVIRYLERVDRDAAAAARARYACFSGHTSDPMEYGRAAAASARAMCAQQAAEQYQEMQRRVAATAGGRADPDLFNAEQNARVVRNAEEYYRVSFSGGEPTWNIRDRHMVETVAAIAAHLEARGQRGKVAVWAHNSHVGDARATDMAARGELNIGQLARERWGEEAFLLGFTTHHGTVIAASDWGMPHRRMNVRPALAESYGALFHETGVPAFLLIPRGTAVEEPLSAPRLQRAIGVIYRPDSERISHYFMARLSPQFDAVLHFDETRAVDPL